MTASTYLPAEGVVALDDVLLGALADNADGLRMAPAARAWFAAAGALDGDRLDPPLRPIAALLAGAGPRLRLRSHRRGVTTTTDVVLAAPHTAVPDTAAPGAVAPDAAGPGGGALVAVRPQGAGVTHLRHTGRGAVTRELARRLGVGPHLAAAPFGDARTLPGWPELRAAVDGPQPAGWAAGHRHAELHDLRWSPGRGVRARTALVVVRLDGALAEARRRDAADAHRPGGAPAGAVVVHRLDTCAAWLRLCRLTNPAPAPA